MRIHELKLTNFRNIPQATINTDGAPIVALYGPNGAGKTSVLEALALLSPGRGLHRTPLESHRKHGESSWTIFATSGSDNTKIGMEYKSAKRTIKINGENCKNQTELSAIGNVMWFTPKMDRLFIDSTTARREFIDRLVFGVFPNHARLIAQYKHHLKSRISLLKSHADIDWIKTEEQQAATLALQIHNNRMQFLERLSKHLAPIALSLSGSFERLEDLSEKTILERWQKDRSRDAQYNTTHLGPHRTDVAGSLIAEDISLKEASTGQHKRAILEILLANARLMKLENGQQPLVLLDEVTAHLDKKARHYFFNELTQLGTQIWLTGTESELFDELENAVKISVNQGIFTKQSND